MNLFDLYARVALDTSDYDSGVDKVSKSGSSLASRLKNGFTTAGKVAAKGIAVVGAAATAGAAMLNSMAESTREYRDEQARLNTAFENAGFSGDVAAEAYGKLYSVLGDTGQATEASQLLAKLAENTEQVSQWTTIATGVVGTFGDSLPVESLIEASNETAKVGTVTGTLADALNWAGVSEDEFNEKLAACADQTERTTLITETLNDIYADAAQGFQETNEEVIKYRETQTKLTNTMSKVGGAVDSVKTKLLNAFAPAIEKVGDKVTGFIDKLGEAFDEGGLKGMVSAAGEIIGELVSELAAAAPDLIEIGFSLLTSFIEGIVDNIPAIVDAAVKVVLAFIDGLVDMLPVLIDGAFKLFMGILEALPEIISKLAEAMPEIIVTIVKGLKDGIGDVLKAAGELFFGIVDEQKKASEELSQSVSLIKPFLDEIKNATPTLADVNGLLSDYGRTLGEIDQEIGETEEKITEILKKQFEYQQGLREEDLENIRKYQEELNALNEEKLDIYQSQQVATLRKLQVETNNIDQETAVQHLANVEQALEDANAEVDRQYTDRITIIENKYAAMGQLYSDAYWNEIEAAKQWKNDMLAENQSYADQSNEIVFQASQEWMATETEKWGHLTEAMAQYRVDTDNEMTNLLNNAGDFTAAFDGVKTEYIKQLEDMDLDTAEAFFSMLGSIQSTGQEIDPAAREVAANILGAFDGLPEDMGECGRDALEGMVQGLKQIFPELEDTSDMSVQEIVDTVKGLLEIQSPSRVMAEIGRNTMLGLVNGLNEEQGSTTSTMRSLVNSLVKVGKDSYTSFRNIGKNMGQGMRSGLNSTVSSIINSAVSAVSSVVSSVNRRLGIHSPSKVFAQIGTYMAEGLDEGWQEEFQTTRQRILDGMDFERSTSRPEIQRASRAEPQTEQQPIILSIDGHELARFLAPAMSKRLAFDT